MHSAHGQQYITIAMTGRKTEHSWWQEITRSDRFNGVEWLLLGVSAFALTGALMVLMQALA